MKLHRAALILSPILLGAGCPPENHGPGFPDGDPEPAPPPSLRVEAAPLLVTSEMGQQVSFSVRLGTAPSAGVSVTVSPLEPSEWRRVGEFTLADELAGSAGIQLQRVLRLRYPHTADGVNLLEGVHNQAYHVEGGLHYSVGTRAGEGEHGSWVFVNHDDGSVENGWTESLQCASRLIDPFAAALGDVPGYLSSGKVHAGGGWFHEGRYYTAVSNEVETNASPERGDEPIGLLAIVSFGPAADCDASADPDAFDGDGQPACGCDVAWVEDEAGKPLIYRPNDYMGLGARVLLDGEERALIASTTGDQPWVCQIDGTDCQTLACATGAADCADALATEGTMPLRYCGLPDFVCPQACTPLDGGSLCSNFPLLGDGDPRDGYVYLYDGANLDDIGDFQSPHDQIRLPTDAVDGGEVGNSNPEGIAWRDGELYLAGDHLNEQGANCGGAGLASPCTDNQGDQIVRVYAPYTVGGDWITFDAENWDIPQTITLAGVDDAAADGDADATLSLLVSSVESDWAALSGTITVSVRNLDDETADPTLGLDAIEPAIGSEAGGTTVVLTGTGLSTVRSVKVGGVSAELVGADIGSVAFVTPPGSPGVVDVVVERSDDAVETLPGAFTYFADAQGLYSGIARAMVVSYDPSVFYIGSGYGPVGTEYLQVDGLFHAPIPAAQTLFGADAFPGDCVGAGGAAWSALAAADGLTLDSTHGESMVMSDYDDIVFYALIDGVVPSTWSGQSFDIGIVHEGGPLPAQSIVDAVRMPGYPEGLGWDVSATNYHNWGEDLTLSWTSDAPIDGLTYTIWPGVGTTALAEVTCTVDGAGPLVLPWAELVGGADPNAVRTLMVSLTFWRDHATELGHDRSLFWGRGYYQLWYYVVLL